MNQLQEERVRGKRRLLQLPPLPCPGPRQGPDSQMFRPKQNRSLTFHPENCRKKKERPGAN